MLYKQQAYSPLVNYHVSNAALIARTIKPYYLASRTYCYRL